MNILFATAELAPFAKTGGLGDVCGVLPKVLAAQGMNVAVFTPWYSQAQRWFAARGIEPEVLFPSMTVSWAGWSHQIGVLRSTLPGSAVPVIFIANDYFYSREQIYSNTWSGTDDHFERYVVFCRAVINVMEALGGSIDIVHAHDWHTALLPVYLHSGLRGSTPFSNARSVYTIHNLNYQGQYPTAYFPGTGLHSRYWQWDALNHYESLNLMKGGIVFSDQLTTVSPNYAREIQTAEFGAGLDGLLRDYWWKLTGILNGIDVGEWNPATDQHLPARYSADDLQGKALCKQALCQEAGFHYDPDRLLIGVVSRLVDQKGFDLLLPILSALVSDGAQIVILGSGEKSLEDGFRHAESIFPHSVRAWIGFDNDRAHRITAGADIILMPSRYEPCGLNQMYGLRYGSPPVVRLTGGLADTVFPLDGPDWWRANGFGFGWATPEALLGAIRFAMQTFRQKQLWHDLQMNGMRADFSWETAARNYIDVYRRASATPI